MEASRSPVAYRELAVEDTLDGRFDMICLHVALLTRRLSNRPRLARAVLGVMFSDLDGCLREAGVSDMGVPRRVRVMAEAYHGRAAAYSAALRSGDVGRLEAALLRNLWRGRDGLGPQARLLAAWAMRQDAALASQPDQDLERGRAWFAPLASPAGWKSGRKAEEVT